MLIEENSEDARRFEECLVESGQEIRFHRVSSLDAGLSVHGESHPDVLAYGLQNGVEVEALNTIGATAPGVPVVMLTDADSLEGATTAREAGAAEYLRKSELSPALLGRTVRWAAERAQFQGKLRQRDAWIRSITESNAGGVFRTDPMGRIQYANQALANLLGFAREEELVGLDLKSLYADPDDQGRLLAENGAEEAEVEFECPDGSTFVGLLSAEPAQGTDGRVLHYDGFLVDITDRKEREEELRREKERFEALVQEVKEYAIFMLDREGYIRSWNEGARRIKGYSREEIIGEPLSTFYTEEAQEAGVHEENLRRAEAEGSATDEGWRVRADGSKFWAHVTITALHGDDGSLRGFAKVTRDMTARKEREEELRREKERFEALVQEVKEYAIFMLDREGYIRSWNEGARRIKGYRREEIIGEPLSTFYTEDAQEAGVHEENLRRAEAEGSATDEGWRVRADGSKFWAHVTITALHNDDGSLRGFAKVTRDMTDRNKRERRYEAIFNQTYQFIGLMEPDGTLLEANETALQFGGIERDEVVGKPFWEAYWWQIDEETQQELREAIDRAAEGEFIRYDVEVQGGEENIIIDFSIRPVWSEQGEVTLLIPEGRNITELKALKERERELERTRNLLAQAQRLADVGGWKIDVREDPPYVPEWTDKLYDLLEIPRDQNPTMEEVLEFLPSNIRKKREATIERALTSGEGWDQESRMVTSDGEERWVRSIGEAVFENGEVVALQGAFQDITDRKEREEQLERQNRRLDEFASLVSHDLRGPINVMQMRLELAEKEDDPSHLAAAERALSRMNAIIEDLLTLTWGGQDLDPEEVGTHSLADLAKASWGYVDTANVTLQLEGDLDVRAEEGRLRRLLENLFRNAVEHGPEEGTVRVAPLDGGFFVEDDGPGIPTEKREEVLEAGHSSAEEGTGLGLSIVKSIVETHGWTLEVIESEEGGARFEITGVE